LSRLEPSSPISFSGAKRHAESQTVCVVSLCIVEEMLDFMTKFLYIIVQIHSLHFKTNDCCYVMSSWACLRDRERLVVGNKCNANNVVVAVKMGDEANAEGVCTDVTTDNNW